MLQRYVFVYLTKGAQKRLGITEALFVVRCSMNFVWLREESGRVFKVNRSDVDERSCISWRGVQNHMRYDKLVCLRHNCIAITLRKYVAGDEKNYDIQDYYNYCLSVLKKHGLDMYGVYTPPERTPEAQRIASLEECIVSLQRLVKELHEELKQKREADAHDNQDGRVDDAENRT